MEEKRFSTLVSFPVSLSSIVFSIELIQSDRIHHSRWNAAHCSLESLSWPLLFACLWSVQFDQLTEHYSGLSAEDLPLWARRWATEVELKEIDLLLRLLKTITDSSAWLSPVLMFLICDWEDLLWEFFHLCPCLERRSTTPRRHVSLRRQGHYLLVSLWPFVEQLVSPTCPLEIDYSSSMPVQLLFLPEESSQLRIEGLISLSFLTRWSFTLTCRCLLVGAFFQLDVDERFTDIGRVIDIVIEFNDGSIVSRSDRHIGFVRLNFTDLIELLHGITDFHVPFFHFDFPNAFADVGEFELDHRREARGRDGERTRRESKACLRGLLLFEWRQVERRRRGRRRSTLKKRQRPSRCTSMEGRQCCVAT